MLSKRVKGVEIKRQCTDERLGIKFDESLDQKQPPFLSFLHIGKKIAQSFISNSLHRICWKLKEDT